MQHVVSSKPGAPRVNNFLSCLLAAPVLLLAAPAWSAPEETIVTDRPDFVESSNVVGIRRLQVETSVAVERNKDALIRERTVSTPTLLRYGISDSVELRLETDGRLWYKTEDALAGSHTERGYSDTSLGVKWHAFDARDVLPSVGILLHADLASGSKAFRGHGVRPSLRMAAEWELPDDMSLGVMPGIVSETTDSGARYRSGIFGIVLGKSWNDKLRSFVELSAPRIARASDGGTALTFDVGAAYLLSPSCQVDTAISRGLNRNTADLSWTVGLSFKL